MDSHSGQIPDSAAVHQTARKIVYTPKKHPHMASAISRQPHRRYMGAAVLLISLVAELCTPSESLVLSDASNFAANSRAQPVIANDLAEPSPDLINSTTSGIQLHPQRRQAPAPMYQSIYQQPSHYHKPQQTQHQQPQTHSVAGDAASSGNNAMVEPASPPPPMRSSSSKLPIINGNRATYVEPPADFKPIIYDSFATAASETDPYLVAAPPAGSFGSAAAGSMSGSDGELGAEVSSNHLQPSISSAPGSPMQSGSNNNPKRSTIDSDKNKHQHKQQHNQQVDGEDNGSESAPLKPSIGRWNDWHDMSIEPDLASSDTHLYVQQSRPDEPQPQAVAAPAAAAAPSNANGVHSHRTRYGSAVSGAKQSNGQSHILIPAAMHHQQPQQSPAPSAIPADSSSSGLDAARQQVTGEVILDQQRQQQQQTAFPGSDSSAPVVFPVWTVQSSDEPRSWANTPREVQQSRVDPTASDVRQQQDNILSLMRVADFYHKQALQQQQQQPPASPAPMQSWKLIHRGQHQRRQVLSSPQPLSGGSKMIKMRLVQAHDDGGDMNDEGNNGNNKHNYPHQFHNYRRARNPVEQQQPPAQRYFHYYLQQNHNGDQSMALQSSVDGEGTISGGMITKQPFASSADPSTDSWVNPPRSPRTQDHLHPHHNSNQPAAAVHHVSQSSSSALVSMPMSAQLFQPPHTSSLPDAPSSQAQIQTPIQTQLQTTSVSSQPMSIQAPLRSSAPKRRRRKSKTTNAEVRIQQLVVAPSSSAPSKDADALPLLAPVVSSDKTGTNKQAHIRQQHPLTYSQLIQRAEQARDMSLLKQVNGLDAPQKAPNGIHAHHHHHRASSHRNDYNQHQSALVDTAGQHFGMNVNQIENLQLMQANSAASLANRQKPAVLVRRFGAPMAQLSAATNGNNNGIGVSRKANGGGQAAPKRVLRRRRIKTVLPVGLSTWILGGIRDLDGRHWQLPADVINRLAVNDVDLHHEVPISSVQPPAVGNVEILNADGHQYSPASSTSTTVSAPETENATPSTHRPIRPPSQLIPR